MPAFEHRHQLPFAFLFVQGISPVKQHNIKSGSGCAPAEAILAASAAQKQNAASTAVKAA
jgi:hypothetical protein